MDWLIPCVLAFVAGIVFKPVMVALYKRLLAKASKED